MGVSTNGILIFGFNLGDPNEEEDFPKVLLSPPNEVIGDDPLDILDAITPEGEECPVILERHCSNDYPMYILGVAGARTWNVRGYPTEVKQEMLEVSQERIDRAKKWCEDHDIKWRTPKWLLASYWG